MVLFNSFLTLAAAAVTANAASIPRAISEPAPTNLETRTNNQLLVALLTQNSAVASAPCSVGTPYQCVASVSYNLVVNFFNGYVANNDKRDIETPEDVWTPVGSSVVDGVPYDVHSFRSGNVRGLRAYQGGYTAKRSDESNVGGFVGDYYWNAPNQAAYNSFHSTDSMKHSIANDIANFLKPLNGIEACVDFQDSDGVLNAGVMAFGWNNTPFKYSSTSAIDARLTKCQFGQVLHDGETQQEFSVSK